LIAYYFYAESGIIYLFRHRPGSRWEQVVIRLLQVPMVAAVVFGAVRETDLIWQLGDIGVGLMAWVTIIAVLLLSPKAIRALKDYEKSK
nr:alanine:cation symporter family protein [Bacteroidales bacterium]